MSHTTVASLTVDFESNLDGRQPDTVFFADSRTVGVGVVGEWDTVDLDRPFEYNGTDNLLVEVTWNGLGGGDEDAVVRYGFSSDGTYRRAWEWDWQAATAQRADNCEYNTLFGFTDAGIVEVAPRNPQGRMKTTVVRNVLVLDDDSPSILLDASGRRTIELVPGANDLSRLQSGIYFLRKGTGVAAIRQRIVLAR
jgi:hypothetical protein